jgi:hypothetical protein
VTEYMTNFTGEDMKVAIAEDSKKNNDEAAPQAQEQAVEEQPEAEEKSGTGVPDGTTAEVLAWVGDDKERAQAALDKENADESPRKGLTGELEKLLEDEEE